MEYLIGTKGIYKTDFFNDDATDEEMKYNGKECTIFDMGFCDYEYVLIFEDGHKMPVYNGEFIADNGCQCEECSKGYKHLSSCAVHNEPAFSKGECNCK